MSDSNQEVNEPSEARREALRAKAKEMLKNKVMKPGSYGFIEDQNRVLERKENKPPTLVVDCYPLANIQDASTFDMRFKNTLWVPLVGVEGWEPENPAQRDQCIRTLQCLFPKLIPAITKEKDGYYYKGDKLVGNTAFEDAKTDQLIYCFEVAERVWAKKLSVASGQFFFAAVTVSEDKTRNWVNPTPNTPDVIATPEELPKAA